MENLLLNGLLSGGLSGNEIDTSLTRPIQNNQSLDSNSIIFIVLLVLLLGGGLYYLNR